jgi:hypothetical protein
MKGIEMRLAIGMTAALWAIGICVAAAQAPADRVPNAEEVFKNIQVLKGIPVDQFMGTMGFFLRRWGSTAPTATRMTVEATGPSTPTIRRSSGARASWSP